MSDAIHDAREPFVLLDYAALDQIPAIGATAFTVYVAMVRCASRDTHQCFPARSHIAKVTGLSVRTVAAAITKLSEAGLITVERRMLGGLKTSNLYTISPVGRGAESAHRGAESAPTNGQNLHSGGAESAHRTRAIELDPQEQETVHVKGTAPQPPTLPAGKPGDQGAASTVPTRATGGTSRAAAQRSTRSPRAPSPEGSTEGRGGRWHGVATAIMAALGRPEPVGKLPTWLGNTIRVFGAAAGDDPAVAAALVLTWSRSTALRQAMEGGYLRDHTVPSLAGQWIATSGKRYGAVAPVGVDPVAEQMKAVGAPANWRDIVYAPGGVRRAPQLALPRMNLEPYTRPADWPAWYRAFEGVDA